MKSLKISFVALVIAVAAFAFTTPKSSAFAGCNDPLLKWFVLDHVDVPVANVATAYLSAFTVPDLLNDASAEGNDFNTSLIKTKGTRATAYTETGCDEENVVICAIGYLPSQLIRQQIPGSNPAAFEWKAPSTTPECVIVRSPKQ